MDSSPSSSSETAQELVKPQVVRGVLRTLRPHQWIKNLFVLAPLFFSKQFLVPLQSVKGVVAALLFCLTAGTVYLFNDVFDVEKDRAHPVKCKRPIASGQLPVRSAVIAACFLGAGSVLTSFLIDIRLGAVVSIYLTMNLAYSTFLKNIAFLDVSIIAFGFVLRVLAGAFAINVFISEWLFICTFLLALYLGLGKRLHEMLLVESGEVKKARKVLEHYRLEHLQFGVLFVAGLTISAYTIYTLAAALPNQPLRATVTPFASPWLPITIPLAIFGVVRFYQLLQMQNLKSPTELILRDKVFIANLLIWGVVMAILGFGLLPLT